MIDLFSRPQPFYRVQPNSREWTLSLCVLWLWLGLGACLLLAMTRSHHELRGWEVYWLVIAPAFNLIAVRWRTLAAALASRVRVGRRPTCVNVQARFVHPR